MNFGFKEKRPIQRSIAELELMSVNKEHMIVISDVYGGQVRIVYNGEGRFLVLDEDQNIINI